MSNKIKILLVDDHTLMMYGLRNLIEHNKKFQIVGEAVNGYEAIELFNKLHPDVVMMDISMPELDGIEATKKIKKKKNAKVIIMSSFDDEKSLIQADMAGADGYLFKNCDRGELYEAITNVVSGQKYYSSAIPQSLIEKIIGKKYLAKVKPEKELTKREIEIIKAIAEGLSNKEISKKLFISDRTVNTHRTNIIMKLDVKNSVELVAKAIRNKII